MAIWRIMMGCVGGLCALPPYESRTSPCEQIRQDHRLLSGLGLVGLPPSPQGQHVGNKVKPLALGRGELLPQEYSMAKQPSLLLYVQEDYLTIYNYYYSLPHARTER